MRPNSRKNLDIAIERIAGTAKDAVRIRRIMANTVVGQLLPNGVVKGGSSLKLRFGDATTRFSRDLDTARLSGIEEFSDALERALREGWHGFTGRLVRGRQASPKDVPRAYVMQPFEVKLSYNGKSWITVPLEVGHNEIGDAEEPDMLVPKDAARIFDALGFPPLRPMPFMKLTYQVAQKLHGLTEDGSERAHDLVDLQVIFNEEEIALPEVKSVCLRLFDYRRQQSWPPRVAAGRDWEIGYSAAAEGLDILSFDDAITWANHLITAIDSSRDS